MSDIAERLSLSTCWCSGRHTDGYAMIKEMAGLGFRRIELSHGIRISLVPGILQALEEKLVGISSVHNFCPLPVGVQQAAPNLYEPSALDPREKALWDRHTMQTLDFAVEVGAGKVVMHSGSKRYRFRSPEKKLRKWIHAQGLKAIELQENDAFKKQRGNALRRIKKASKAPMQRVAASYGRAISWARERNLKLGIENREGLEELPVDSNFADFIAKLSAPEQVGYWHDAGHAQIKHQLGLLDHREHLAKMADHLIGFHLHDVTEDGMDHQTLGTGTVDFQMIAEFVRLEHVLVLELSPQLTKEEVLNSRDYMCSLLARR